MRKGRSSRKSRVSRPLIGVKSGDALHADVGPPSTPRVVVGSPPSEALPVAETKSEAGPAPQAKGKSFASTIALGSEHVPEPSKKKEPEAKEATRKLASTIAFGSQAMPESSPVPTQKSGQPAPASPARVEPRKVAQAPLPEPVKVEAKPREKTAEKATPDLSRTIKGDALSTPALKASKKKSEKTPAVAPSVDPDELSVPPIGDVLRDASLDDHEFFSEADVSRHIASESERIRVDVALTVPDKAQRKADPEVVERRARFARWVKFAVGGAAVVCLAAAATSLAPKSPPPSERLAAAAAAPSPAEPKAAEPAAAPSPPPPSETAPPAKAEEPPPPPPPAAETAAPSADPPKEEVAKEPVTGDAKEEKTKARTNLERRKLAEAIEAGERSVALDPTDGEAWLILGAAYQEKGNMTDARRAYSSCVKEAKTGPKAECAKMLR